MFKNALISVNWSGTGVDAVALARRLCPDETQLTLAHVHPEVPLSPDPLVMHLRKFELRHSQRALKGASFATQIESTLSVGAPSVGEGLSGLVSMIGADLLVLGPVEPDGAVSAELADWLGNRPATAPSAVAIASRGFAAGSAELRRVGVVWDTAEANPGGLAPAQDLADRLGSRLKVFKATPVHAGASGSRRDATVTQRLLDFSARVDLLIVAAGSEALAHTPPSPLLLLNDCGVLSSAAPHAARESAHAGSQGSLD
jgi:hypothetical protein